MSLSLSDVDAIRKRILLNEPIELAMLEECVAVLRKHRTAVTTAKAKKPIINADGTPKKSAADLLADLEAAL